MRYRVERFPHPQYENQLLPMLVDSQNANLPEPSAALWSWDLWLHQRYNTVYGRLIDIAAFYSYVDAEYPHFFTDAAKLKFLDSRKIAALSSHLLINFKAGAASGVSVSPSSFNRRIDSLVSFLEFHYSRYIDRVLDIELADKHRRAMAQCLRRIGKLRYNAGEVDNGTDSAKPLTEEHMALIRLVIRPSTEEFRNPINPFRRQLQLRNAILIELLYELGGRAAEIVLIRATDEDLELTTSPTVVLQNDGLASTEKRGRRDGANHKTRHRALPISSGLAGLIVDYLEESRPELRKRATGERTPYLFVSEKDGGPITVDGLDYVLSRLFRKVPELDDAIHAHQFRVTKGIEVRKGVDAEYEGKNSPIIKAGDMQDTLTTWGGWSSRSTMPQHYTKEHIQQALRKYLAAIKD